MPIRGNKLYCPVCNHEQPQINLVRCKRCGNALGAPNVNEVSTDEEITALKQRYNIAKDYLHARGHSNGLDAFEQFFIANVAAVINLYFEPLKKWMLDDEPYRNYYRLTDDGIRDISLPENDRKRSKVDGFLFGSYSRDMIFAALSLCSKGLTGYGDCTVVLEENIISHRATVIEENSYSFAKKHDINFEVVKIPLGFRALWATKHQLAVSKLFEKLTDDCNDEDFCNFVLFSDGNRETEEFMEVHIYNELSNFAVKNVVLPNVSNRKTAFDIKKMNSKYLGKIFIV